MAQRINSISMSQPDAYGNTFGSMVPQGTIKPATDLASKKKWEQMNKALDSTAYNTDRANVAATKAQFEQFKPAEFQSSVDPNAKVDPLAATTQIGAGAMQGANQFKDWSLGENADGTEAKMGKVGGAALGAAVQGAGVAGGHFSKQGREGLGGALSGASMGASMGAAAGPIGMAIGAGVGAIAGGLIGHKKKKGRLKVEKEEKAEIERYNKKLKKLKRQAINRAEDLDKYQNILNNAMTSSYQKGGVIAYKKPNSILRYGSFDINKAQKYIDDLKVERHKEGGKIEDKPLVEELEKGGKVNDRSAGNARGKQMQAGTKASRTFKMKKGGKTASCKKGCKCKTCGKKASQPGIALIFRRGGVVDLEKQNVIVDGPSHDEENNTGVKGDKGLPVVRNGAKVAEIESDELVINASSSKKIEELARKAKSGDKKAAEELGEIVSKELGHNTYDYSNLMD